jgi:hypothetical protein
MKGEDQQQQQKNCRFVSSFCLFFIIFPPKRPTHVHDRQNKRHSHVNPLQLLIAAYHLPPYFSLPSPASHVTTMYDPCLVTRLWHRCFGHHQQKQLRPQNDAGTDYQARHL